jgi:hypothetical protein
MRSAKFRERSPNFAAESVFDARAWFVDWCSGDGAANKKGVPHEMNSWDGRLCPNDDVEYVAVPPLAPSAFAASTYYLAIGTQWPCHL